MSISYEISTNILIKNFRKEQSTEDLEDLADKIDAKLGMINTKSLIHLSRSNNKFIVMLYVCISLEPERRHIISLKI